MRNTKKSISKLFYGLLFCASLLSYSNLNAGCHGMSQPLTGVCLDDGHSFPAGKECFPVSALQDCSGVMASVPRDNL